MHKGLILFFMMGTLFVASAVYADDSKPLGFWAGKLPSTGFWEDDNVRSIMKRYIPAELVEKIISGWGGGVVEAPMTHNGERLSVFVCKAHDCAANAARLYFNFKEKTVQLCWTERHQEQVLDMLFSGAEVKRLSPDACAEQYAH